MRLSKATADALPALVQRAADPRGGSRRVVHLGIGAFHRAHQAVYTQDANTAADTWGITGVSLRSSTVRDTLAPQDGLYTVTTRSNGAATTRLMTVIDEVLVADEDSEAVIAALADKDTHIVTLTVTEKGYCRHPASGTLDLGDTSVAADLSGDAPRTIYGYLRAALSRRRAEGLSGLTLVSCDNLSNNGTLLMRLLLQFLDRADPDLADWTRTHVAAPNTMVDRIVPAPTQAERAAVAADIGMEDAAAIVTEPFSQWVIEDRFAGPRPCWDAAGAQIVADVAPFELAKLRLLNASHSALAYIGLQLGHEYVHEAIADDDLRAFVLAQMRREAVACLREAPGLDPDAYIAALVERFGNADLRHRLDQIASDGSQKLPQRWFATIEERLAEGLDSPMHVAATAAWIAYTADAPSIASDPLRPRFAEIWTSEGDDATRIVSRFVGDLGIFGASTAASEATCWAIADILASWRRHGARDVLARLVKEQRA